ncbi:MAG TPA: hypothetical protein VH392_11575 [Sphingomicrobium sp.]|jgi:hypothetical protein
MRSADGQRTLDRLLAGKVAGRPTDCVPNYNISSSSTIDGRTIVFDRPGTAYLIHLTPGCEMIENHSYALLSRQFGGLGLCRGDIQHVIDTVSRTTAGSCGVAEIIPYTRP